MTTNLRNQLNEQIDGQSDEYKEVIIQNETQKFIELFDRIFSGDEISTNDLDNTDGIVEDILNAIVNRIRAIIKQKFIKIIEKEEQEEQEEEEEEENGED